MTAVIHVVIFLAILLIAIVTGFSLSAAEPQEDGYCFSCDGDLSSGWSLGWPKGHYTSPRLTGWEQIQTVLGGKTAALCGKDEEAWWRYFKKKRLQIADVLTDSVCGLHFTLKRWNFWYYIGIEEPEEETRWEAFTNYIVDTASDTIDGTYVFFDKCMSGIGSAVKDTGLVISTAWQGTKETVLNWIASIPDIQILYYIRHLWFGEFGNDHGKSMEENGWIPSLNNIASAAGLIKEEAFLFVEKCVSGFVSTITDAVGIITATISQWRYAIASWMFNIPGIIGVQDTLKAAWTYAWEEAVDLAALLPQPSGNPGFWNCVLVSFFIWRTLREVFGEKEVIQPTQTSAKPTRHHRAFTKDIGKKFVATKMLSTGKNFHMFHLMSKITRDNVFMKCLRSGASRAAKIGLAREFRILGTISHNNVIRLVGWMRAGLDCSLSLEFAKYGNLQQALISNVDSFQLRDKMSVFKQIVQAVAYLHYSKMAHLNIRAKSVLIFCKWSLVKLSGFHRVVKVNRRKLCNRFDLHPAAVPADVVLKRELYDPLKVDSWALGSILLYLLTGDLHCKGDQQKVPMIKALEECCMKEKKLILTLLSRLMSVNPRARPEPLDILRQLDALKREDLKTST